MKKIFDLDSEKGYYNLITLFICFGIIVLTAVVLCTTYIVKAVKQDRMLQKINIEQEYNDIYFSDKILPGVSVSGNDIGKMTKDEAKVFLLQSVSNNIDVEEIVLTFEDKQWRIGADKLALAIDIDYAVERAWKIGREGDSTERDEILQKLTMGEKIDVSATTITDSTDIMALLESIKSEIDIKRKDATVTFTYDKAPIYTYTDEVVGRSLNLKKTYSEICDLIREDSRVINYQLSPEEQLPKIKRADIEKEYTLVAKYKTYISSANTARRKNVTIALEAFNARTWMPGETLSFNQWVGERTAEKGFGNGVYINEQQLYDETMGGGICQVSTTVYYCALLCGANRAGQNAPIVITERRPHTWPSVYIDKGLDATISWPHTDLKLYNNNQTPYFLRTYMTSTGVNVEIYGTPLPNDAKVKIETEIIEEIPAGEPEKIIDTENKYNLLPGQEKLVQEAHTGYTINVYQIWSQPGQDDIKSLITVSKYNPVPAKYYVGA